MEKELRNWRMHFDTKSEGPVITRLDPDRAPSKGGQRINIAGP